MRKEDLDKRICDVELGATNTETYREFLINSMIFFSGNENYKIPDFDSLTEEFLNELIDEYDYLWGK